MHWQEWIDTAVPSLLVAGVVGLIAVTVGSAITLLWNVRQKAREIDLETAREFHSHYGSFFAVWKIWNQHIDSGTNDPERENKIFEQAAIAEGGMESILSRVAAHRRLTTQMVEDLACFRQSFQCLRQAIRDRKKLVWWSSDVIEYRRFKELSNIVSGMIINRPIILPFKALPRSVAWAEITSNRWEGRWAKVSALAELRKYNQRW